MKGYSYIFFTTELDVTVCEVAGLPLGTVPRLHVVLADLGLVEQGDGLGLRGLLAAGWGVLGQCLRDAGVILGCLGLVVGYRHRYFVHQIDGLH